MIHESLDWKDAAERRFSEYVEAIAGVLGHADRREPMHAYCTGLLLPGKRKSVEPMAARSAFRRPISRCITSSPMARPSWTSRGLPAIERRSRRGSLTIRAFPARKGRQEGSAFCWRCPAVLRPVGQAGQLPGRGYAANDHASLPVACRLYLPEVWADASLGRRRMSHSTSDRARPDPRCGCGRAASC